MLFVVSFKDILVSQEAEQCNCHVQYMINLIFSFLRMQ